MAYASIITRDTLCDLDSSNICNTCGAVYKNADRPGRCLIKVNLALAGQLQIKRKCGLGDWTEQALRRLGITQDKWIAVKAKLGLAPTCGCCGRKQKLNDWTHKVKQYVRKITNQQTT